MLKFFKKLKSSLSKTKEKVVNRLTNLVGMGRKIDDELLDEIEEILIEGDIGVSTSMKIIEELKIRVKEDKIKDSEDIIGALKSILLDIVRKSEDSNKLELTEKPYVIMVVGVNGVGKTTTIGKLSKFFADKGKKVLLSASDTFRAAAVEQLEIWAKRSNVGIIKQKNTTDPASVAYDALNAAKARDIDVLIVDTAGRLHTKTNLMEELKKIKRVLKKIDETTPHQTLLILDASTGQNAVSQAKLFNESIEIDGLVLTKLDGTAKGGIVAAISDQLDIPVKFIGVGEQLDDLKEFNAEEFIEALFA